MNVKTLLMAAAAYAPRVMQISRKTWLLIGGTLLLILVLLTWLVFASAQWLFHQGRDAAHEIVNHAPGISQAVIGQVENVAPGAKEKLAGVLDGLAIKTTAPREVGGTDIAPVPRFAGLVRTAWDKSGSAHYEGKADMTQMLAHYNKEFTQQDFIETKISSTQESEVLEYIKNQERYRLTSMQKSASLVQLKMEKLQE
ncbi:MAG: hypothetical protein K2Y28_15160 [Burkholderiaceae bacterium]|nr:hypothetical protein [Burkholderiaceae bacterium]